MESLEQLGGQQRRGRKAGDKRSWPTPAGNAMGVEHGADLSVAVEAGQQTELLDPSRPPSWPGASSAHRDAVVVQGAQHHTLGAAEALGDLGGGELLVEMQPPDDGDRQRLRLAVDVRGATGMSASAIHRLAVETPA
jgi:hypothetical protein